MRLASSNITEKITSIIHEIAPPPLVDFADVVVLVVAGGGAVVLLCAIVTETERLLAPFVFVQLIEYVVAAFIGPTDACPAVALVLSQGALQLLASLAVQCNVV